MSNPYVLPSLLVLGFGSLALVAYAVKRYFDDRAAARLAESGIAEALVKQMGQLAAALSETESKLQLQLDANSGVVRDRLRVFEDALKNAISQFAEIVASTKESEIQNKARIAGALARGGRRMPNP